MLFDITLLHPLKSDFFLRGEFYFLWFIFVCSEDLECARGLTKKCKLSCGIIRIEVEAVFP